MTHIQLNTGGLPPVETFAPCAPERPNARVRRPLARAATIQAFVEESLADCVSANDEVQVLLSLFGVSAAREAMGAVGGRLLAALGSPEFEDEQRCGPDMATVRLRRLAALRVRINASALADEHRAWAAAVLRRIAQLIHDDAAAAETRAERRRAARAARLASPAPGSGSE